MDVLAVGDNSLIVKPINYKLGNVLTEKSLYPVINLGKASIINAKLTVNIVHDEPQQINIGNDVYINKSVTLIDGITIGNGVIIGPNCTVECDIPDYAILKDDEIVGYRYSDVVIDFLNELKWWDWTEQQQQVNIWFFKESIYRCNTISSEYGKHDIECIKRKLKL